MREIQDLLRQWSVRGERVAIATVVGTRRSAPRPIGAKLAVNERGELAGSVSGGCVEGAVLAACERLLAGGGPRLLTFGIADEEAWEVGLPCGGEIDVWIEEFGGPHHGAFLDLTIGQGRAALATCVSGESPGARMLIRDDGWRDGSLGADELDRSIAATAVELIGDERSGTVETDGRLVFVDVAAPVPRLILIGAMHVSAALSKFAAELGWRCWIIDPRTRFAVAERFPHAEGLLAVWPEVGIAQLGGLDRSTYLLAVSHDPKLDDAALRVALDSDAGYVGAMGSHRATADRARRLVELGIGEEQIDRLVGPVGLDLGGHSVEETALSMLAELVAVRNGRDGGRLIDTEGRIHPIEIDR
jgi:xanthine dehydrogenase accessory factor